MVNQLIEKVRRVEGWQRRTRRGVFENQIIWSRDEWYRWGAGNVRVHPSIWKACSDSSSERQYRNRQLSPGIDHHALKMREADKGQGKDPKPELSDSAFYTYVSRDVAGVVGSATCCPILKSMVSRPCRYGRSTARSCPDARTVCRHVV